MTIKSWLINLLPFNRFNWQNFITKNSGNSVYQSESSALEADQASLKEKRSYSGYRGQRARNLYNPLSTKPFKLSRSKLELFVRCARCFYLDRKLGVGHPPGYPFSLNNAVDTLLKKEFDRYREEQKPHPFCIENGIEVVPFKHQDMDRWRDSLHAGIQYIVPNTNLLVHGGLDDVWMDVKTNELIVVDYKATSKATAVSLDADWQVGYKRQAEIYQWLLRKNGFAVSDTAYFVYCNGKADATSFNKQLNFDVSVLPYKGNDVWVEASILQAYQCLQLDYIPDLTADCDFCQFWNGISKCLGK